MNGKTLAGAIAAALAAASLTTAAGAPAGQESCYGVAIKGQNDCAAGAHSCAGESSVNYDGKDFKYVPAGTCTKIDVDGHKGSLTPA